MWTWESVNVVVGDLANKAVDLAQQVTEIAQQYDLETAKKAILAPTDRGLAGIFPLQATESSDGTSRTRGKNSSAVLPNDPLDLVYITENVIAMAFPCDFSKPDPIENANDIEAVTTFLNQNHAGHYMIWNISEENYDYSRFEDQVLEYKFPGHPAPPLGLLFKICASIESWLDADDKNVAIIHCLTGKGRTAALIACVLTWIGEFSSPMEALQYVADRKSIALDVLTIPSQRRYVQYFSNMLDGVKPRSEPLLLRRVIMSSVPAFGLLDNNKGCCPYVQLFKCGRLIATATPTSSSESTSTSSNNSSNNNGSSGNSKMKLKWVNVEEGNVAFHLDCALQGDILLRVRHAQPHHHSSNNNNNSNGGGARVSMFRGAVHTGYVSAGVLRLYKAQLDGAVDDDRFPDDFFIDLIFAPIEKQQQQQQQQTNSNNSGGASAAMTTTAGGSGVATSFVGVGVANDAGLLLESTTTTATATGTSSIATTTDSYELSLHRDVRFWNSIASRKAKARKRNSRKINDNNVNINAHFTIGTNEEQHQQQQQQGKQGRIQVDDGDFTLPFLNSNSNSSSSNVVEYTFKKKQANNNNNNNKASGVGGDAMLMNWAQLSDEELILQLAGQQPTSPQQQQQQQQQHASLLDDEEVKVDVPDQQQQPHQQTGEAGETEEGQCISNKVVTMESTTVEPITDTWKDTTSNEDEEVDVQPLEPEIQQQQQEQEQQKQGEISEDSEQSVTMTTLPALLEPPVNLTTSDDSNNNNNDNTNDHETIASDVLVNDVAADDVATPVTPVKSSAVAVAVDDVLSPVDEFLSSLTPIADTTSKSSENNNKKEEKSVVKAETSTIDDDLEEMERFLMSLSSSS